MENIVCFYEGLEDQGSVMIKKVILNCLILPDDELQDVEKYSYNLETAQMYWWIFWLLEQSDKTEM